MFARIVILFVTMQSLQSIPAATINGTSLEDPNPIMYPGPVKDMSNRFGSPGAAPIIVPEECKGKSFCMIKPPDYPEERFNGMFRGKIKISQSESDPDDVVFVDNRQGDPSESSGCETKVTYDTPFLVRTKRDDNWRTVIQAHKENFVQRVRLEECVTKQPGAKCFSEAGELTLDTFCKQTYNTWEFLVSDGKDGFEKIKAELPVCCSCHYRLD